jgi:hypothetical protein
MLYAFSTSATKKTSIIEKQAVYGLFWYVERLLQPFYDNLRSIRLWEVCGQAGA